VQRPEEGRERRDGRLAAPTRLTKEAAALDCTTDVWLTCVHVRDGTTTDLGAFDEGLVLCKDCAWKMSLEEQVLVCTACSRCLARALEGRSVLIYNRELLEEAGVLGAAGSN